MSAATEVPSPSRSRSLSPRSLLRESRENGATGLSYVGKSAGAERDERVDSGGAVRRDRCRDRSDEGEQHGDAVRSAERNPRGISKRLVSSGCRERCVTTLRVTVGSVCRSAFCPVMRKMVVVSIGNPASAWPISLKATRGDSIRASVGDATALLAKPAVARRRRAKRRRPWRSSAFSRTGLHRIDRELGGDFRASSATEKPTRY